MWCTRSPQAVLLPSPMSPILELQIRGIGGCRGAWALRKEGEALHFASLAGADAFVVTPNDGVAWPLVTTFGYRGFHLRLLRDGEPVLFELTRRQAKILGEMLGPPTEAQFEERLNAGYRGATWLAILLVILALPMPAFPEYGLEPLPTDYVGLALGVGLYLLAVLRKGWPSRLFFLLDALFFVVIAGDTAYGIYQGDSLWWLLFIAVVLGFVRARLFDYRRFGPPAETSPDAQRPLFPPHGGRR